MPDGMPTFLLTDIEGSTRLWKTHAEAMAAAVPIHDSLLCDAVGRHGGLRPVEQGEGDSAVAVFSRASDAVAAALEAQLALSAQAWPDGLHLRVRIALNTAEAPLGDEGSSFGVALNRCARLRAIAHGGQTLVSRAVHDLVVDGLPDGVGLVDVGLHRLRDLGRPERVFAVDHPDLPARVEALGSSGGHSTSGELPVELSSFVGRDAELAEVRARLASAHTITLTGPGGIGKSRLALHAAHKLRRHFPDGVRIVELADLDSPDLVPYALAHAVGVSERLGDAIETALVDHLRERRLLLVIDNCEHLLDACRELVAAVVSRCEAVRVLCTSRERLGIAGEATVELTALELPANADEMPVAALADVEAVRLLVDRAVAVAPRFALTEVNREAACDICRRLDGLPLAIELAAVRLASMSAEDVSGRLDDRFRLLASDRSAGFPRNHALWATVDWSHELLGEEERVLWRRLSVFAGSFGIEAAETVCSGAGLEREQMVDLVAALVGKSILTMGHGSRRGRYRLLETLRLYGAQRLAEAGEDVEFARRHADWYAKLVSGADRPWWGTPDQGEMFDVLDVDWANIEAALDFCAASPRDTRTGLRMAADLWLYWVVRGRYQAGSRRLGSFLALEPAPDPVRVMALWAYGFLAQATGDYAVALSAAEEARRVCEQAGGEREHAYMLNGLGLAHLRLGNTELALEFGVAARDTMLKVDDPMGQALAGYFLATVLAATGRLADARRLANEALQAGERAGDMMARGITQGVLGTVEWLLGDAPAAEASLKEAVRIQDVIGHRWGLLMSLEGLAWVAGSSGRSERAAVLLGAGAALSEELGIAIFSHGQVHHDACEAAALAGLGKRAIAPIGSRATGSAASRSGPPHSRTPPRPMRAP